MSGIAQFENISAPPKLRNARKTSTDNTNSAVATIPRMPSTSTVTACGCFGGSGGYAG